jgi:hypothetical protein
MLTQESTSASAMPKKEDDWDIGGPKVPPTKLASWLLSAAIPALLLLMIIAIVLIMAFRSTGIEKAKANLAATITLPSYSLAEMLVKPERNLDDDTMQGRLTDAFVPRNEVVHYPIRLKSGYRIEKAKADLPATITLPSYSLAEIPVKREHNPEDAIMQGRLTDASVPRNEVMHYPARLRSSYHPKRKWASDRAANMKSPSRNFAAGTLEEIEYEQAVRQYLHDEAEYQRQLALWRQNRMIQ